MLHVTLAFATIQTSLVGQAGPPAGAQMQLGELLAQGGLTMWPLYACSVVGLTVFLVKLLELLRARLSQFQWLNRVLDAASEGELQQACEGCRSTANPAGRVLLGMLEIHRSHPKHVTDEAKRLGSAALQGLDRGLGVLDFVARVAPLLGLLGTVLGMVDLFMALQGAGSNQLDIAVLASGIWKALLTTAAGLSVAVPMLAAHAYLSARIDRFRLSMSDAIAQLTIRLTPGCEVSPAE